MGLKFKKIYGNFQQIMIDELLPEDAVIMAITGTDSSVQEWWIEAIKIVFYNKYPELENQVNDVVNYLAQCIVYLEE